MNLKLACKTLIKSPFGKAGINSIGVVSILFKSFESNVTITDARPKFKADICVTFLLAGVASKELNINLSSSFTFCPIDPPLGHLFMKFLVPSYKVLIVGFGPTGSTTFIPSPAKSCVRFPSPVPAPINVRISNSVTPDANVGVPPPENIPGSAKDVKPEGLVAL